MMKTLLAVLLILPLAVFAQSPALAPFISSGLTQPVAVVSDGVNDDRLFIVEQGGLIKIYRNGTLVMTPTIKAVTTARNGIRND